MNDHITSSKRRRREHSPQFKRELVSRSLEPGASVAAVALEAGVNSNLLFAWRRMHRDAQAQDLSVTLGTVPMLLPVTVESPQVQVACAPAPPRKPSGVIEIDVGPARVRLRGDVDESAVRLVLAALMSAAK